MNKRPGSQRARIGTFAVGLDTYWAQYPGLLEELLAGHREFISRLKGQDVEVVDFGMIDNALKAQEGAARLRGAALDLLMVDMVTYATSSTIGTIARTLDIPIILVALQPASALDYQRATTYMQLCNDNICALPEFCNTIVRMGKPAPPCIIGMLHDDVRAQAEVVRWVRIATVLHDLKHARIGHIGHPLEAMYDMHTDQTALTRWFGLHVVQAEIDDLVAHALQVNAAEMAAKREEVLALFDLPEPGQDPHTEKLTGPDLDEAARAAVALDRFVEDKALDGLAYHYQGLEDSETRRLVGSLIVGNSLLCARGFPMCGESDLKTCVAMFILDRLGIGGSFAEFHPVDFPGNSVLIGHDGPHHIDVAEGRPVLRSLKQYHGKVGSGASVEFQIKSGPVTMLGIAETGQGRLKFIIAEGESRRNAIPATGNTNTHGYFGSCIRTFLQRWCAEGPTHHFALGVGHYAEELRLLAGALGIEAAVVHGVEAD